MTGKRPAHLFLQDFLLRLDPLLKPMKIINTIPGRIQGNRHPVTCKRRDNHALVPQIIDIILITAMAQESVRDMADSAERFNKISLLKYSIQLGIGTAQKREHLFG